jgi:YfiH family protein
MPKPAIAPSLAALPNVAHGFFTRQGGVSRGLYASLNCGQGSRDDPMAVAENRARVTSFLKAQHLVTAHQTHSATAIVAEGASDLRDRPRADAIVTSKRGLAVGVLAADCAPVLLADRHAGVVGAVHAGWRGGIGGVVEAAIAAMEGLGASKARMRGAVGPCIGQPAYEVGGDFEEEFHRRDAESARFFLRPQAGSRPHFDLAGYVKLRLARAGIAAVEALQLCTFARAEDFFSYRRAQACKEPDYGRQISAIVLT